MATPTRLPRWGPRRSARQNGSPTAVVRCHGARARSDLRGGGRLRSVHWRRRAAFIVCCTAAPGRQRDRCALSAQRVSARRRHRFAEVNHASDARRSKETRASCATSRRRPGAPVPQTKEGRRGKTRRRHLLFTAMALRPGLVFAEVVGSPFCPLTPSRRLHCLLHRRSRPTTRTVAHLARNVCMRDGNPGLLKLNRASDATRGAARKRIGRRGIREAGAKHGLFDRRRHVAERCPPRETPHCGVSMRTSRHELFVRAGEPRRRRPGAAVQQTMKAARQRPWTKRGADHLREDQAWSERHGSEEQMLATRFAAPTFPCLRNRCFRPTTAWVTGSNGCGDALSAKRSPPRKTRRWRVFIAFSLRWQTLG